MPTMTHDLRQQIRHARSTHARQRTKAMDLDGRIDKSTSKARRCLIEAEGDMLWAARWQLGWPLEDEA